MKRMIEMKRIIAVVMILTLALGLAACGSKTSEEAKPFKAGVWSVIKDGKEAATYTFTDSMTECSYDTDKTGVPFDYEIDGNTYIFHMGSADDVSKAKVVFADEDNATIIWESPAREETLRYKGTEAETEAAETENAENDSDFPHLIINSEPFTVTAEDGFESAGTTAYICDATEKYLFRSSTSRVTWKVYVLDKPFEDGIRYLSQAETPALVGDGVVKIAEGKYVYVVCSDNAFSSDSPSDAKVEITYAEGLTGNYYDFVSQRATALVIEDGDEIEITVKWSSSASETTEWEMTCEKDGDKLSYTDCEKTNSVYDESGNADDTVEYDDGEGYFTLKDGKLLWDGAAEENCKTCVFEMQ